MQSFQWKKEKGFLQKKSWRVKGSLFPNCKQSRWLSRFLFFAGSTVNEFSVKSVEIALPLWMPAIRGTWRWERYWVLFCFGAISSGEQVPIPVKARAFSEGWSALTEGVSLGRGHLPLTHLFCRALLLLFGDERVMFQAESEVQGPHPHPATPQTSFCSTLGGRGLPAPGTASPVRVGLPCPAVLCPRGPCAPRSG